MDCLLLLTQQLLKLGQGKNGSNSVRLPWLAIRVEGDRSQVPLKPDPALGDSTQNILLYHRRHHHHNIANSNNINIDDDDDDDDNNNNNNKGKSVPLQARSGPECSRQLSFPDFMTTT